MIQIGNDKIKDIYVGSDKIKEVYYGSEKVWGEIESIQDGYWVHKDTGVITYFGLEDPSIAGGIMNSPSWRDDCSEVQIPTGVTGLGFSCFYNCKSLTSINISEGVTSLGNSCFNGCSALTSITLPEGFTSLGNDCFRYCSSLTSITLPESVTILGSNCLRDCSSLTSITLPEGVTSLGTYCFSGSALTSITLPESVTSLGNDCFNGCASLILATVLPATPPSIGWRVFDNVYISFNIKVHSPYVDAYKTATNWIYYAAKISAI